MSDGADGTTGGALEPPPMVVLVGDGAEIVLTRLESPRPDLEVVDELARLHLRARRQGYAIRVDRPSPALRRLLELVGLSGLLGTGSGSGLEAGREPEGGELLGPEEVVPPADLPA